VSQDERNAVRTRFRWECYTAAMGGDWRNL